MKPWLLDHLKSMLCSHEVEYCIGVCKPSGMQNRTELTILLARFMFWFQGNLDYISIQYLEYMSDLRLQYIDLLLCCTIDWFKIYNWQSYTLRELLSYWCKKWIRPLVAPSTCWKRFEMTTWWNGANTFPIGIHV